jgi:hypothetical protein
VRSTSTAELARASASTPTIAALAPCATGVAVTAPVSAAGDAVLGPLVLVDARRTIDERPTGRLLGYKVPVTLPTGATATLSVAPASRGHVGLVFTQSAKARVFDEGLAGADRAVTFRACGRIGATARTGWPGLFVVDRPRCAVLAVTIGRVSVSHRVPLGRRCSPISRPARSGSPAG